MNPQWLSATIHEFGKGLGLTRLHVNDRGVACVHIAHIGSLFIEPDEEGVLVYLARDYGVSLSRAVLERALLQAHPGTAPPPDIRVGLRHASQLVFGMRLRASECTAAALEGALERLRYAQERVREA